MLEAHGLVALARGTEDMREVLARRREGAARAALGFDVYIYRLAPSATVTSLGLEAGEPRNPAVRLERPGCDCHGWGLFK